jgi:hypothetical protein
MIYVKRVKVLFSLDFKCFKKEELAIGHAYTSGAKGLAII